MADVLFAARRVWRRQGPLFLATALGIASGVYVFDGAAKNAAARAAAAQQKAGK